MEVDCLFTHDCLRDARAHRVRAARPPVATLGLRPAPLPRFAYVDLPAAFGENGQMGIRTQKRLHEALK